MSRRNRGRATATMGGHQEIERLLAKGRVKDAFKQAKVGFRQQPSAENRVLLERTYLLRVKELLRGGMPAAAAEVARSFLEFGVQEPGALGELASLLPQIGLAEEARKLAPRLEDPAAVAALTISLADQAVLKPDRTPSSAAEAKQGAERIRAALAALDDEQEARAMELLADIPRNSPWADWRYFVRGLAAFRRGEADQAGANWDRLDPQRPAHRIAARLRFMLAATSQAGPGSAAAKNDLSAIETAVFGEPLLARLDRLRRLVDQTNPKRDWKQALLIVGSLTATLRRLDPRLAQRLTEILTPALLDQATDLSFDRATELISNFARVAEPWRLDPKWNRLWALCWEETSDANHAAPFWKNYIRDLEQATDLDADQRRRIQALVWRHIGLTLAADDRNRMPNFDDEATEPGTLRTRAIAAMKESLRVDPAQREAQQSLISMLEEWEDPEQAAEARRKLLDAFPDDVETLKSLAAYHLLTADEPQRALDYIRRVRKLQPLDTSLVERERWALISLARHHALDHRWEEGRAAFAQAEALCPDDTLSFGVLARRALLELKAGDKQRADELIERAKAALPEPAPLWLVLAIESHRYKVPAAQRSGFDRELTAALKKKKTGETAGKLAELMIAYQALAVEYKDQKRYLRDVVTYLRATRRTRFEEDDLVRVCRFLNDFCDEPKLLGDLVWRGLKNFKNCPVFHMLQADEDLRTLPVHFNFAGICRRLEKALALAQADPQARYADLIDEIKKRLSMTSNLGEAMEAMRRDFQEGGGLPGGFPGGLPALFNLIGSLGGEEEDEDDNPFSGYLDFGDVEPPVSTKSAGRQGAKRKPRSVR
jgi:tetratricopeptide (TPR) repeat protein